MFMISITFQNKTSQYKLTISLVWKFSHQWKTLLPILSISMFTKSWNKISQYGTHFSLKNKLFCSTLCSWQLSQSSSFQYSSIQKTEEKFLRLLYHLANTETFNILNICFNHDHNYHNYKFEKWNKFCVFDWSFINFQIVFDLKNFHVNLIEQFQYFQNVSFCCLKSAQFQSPKKIVKEMIICF